MARFKEHVHVRADGAMELVLPDRGSRIHLLLRAGKVTGAMGSDPSQWLGLTEAEARKRSRRR